MSDDASSAPPLRPPGPVPSPCINICHIDPASGWCEGCQRTLDEIAAWSTLSDDAKHAVWLQLDARRDVLFPPRAAR